MFNPQEKLAFLHAGLDRYADARETVDYFETAVQELLLLTLRSKETWKHFRPTKTSGQFEFGKSTGPADRFIAAWIGGDRPGPEGKPLRTWMCLGLYWNQPLVPKAHVIAAAHAWGDKGRFVHLADRPDRDPRVELVPTNKMSERRLVVGPLGDVEIQDALALLLTALDDALPGEVAT